MNRKDFAAWCQAATKKIRYGPDREMVSKELRDHLEDRFDALVAQGVPEEEAARQSLEAMGSAETIAPQLAAIHRPWLGWLYTALKVIAVITTLIAMLMWLLQFLAMINMQYHADRFDSLLANAENVIYFERPEITVTVEGYQISIDEIAVTSDDRFYFVMKICEWPWQDKVQAWGDFWAVDSLGNHYYSCNTPVSHDISRIADYGMSGTKGISFYGMVLLPFDSDAEWVDLCYDRDGRDIVFHIDLTGGADHE